MASVSQSLSEPVVLRQTVFGEISGDTTTTSTSYVNIGSMAITTNNGGSLELHFTASCSNTAVAGSTMSFQLTLDGVGVSETTLRMIDATGQQSTGIRYNSGVLAPGVHNLGINWKTDTGTARIRPVTTINEHASLLAKELTV